MLHASVQYFLQVDKLKKDIETERSEKQALEARHKEAEKVIHELNLKLKNVSFRVFENVNFVLPYIMMNIFLSICFSLQLENSNDEKKAKINNYERALKVAEVG